MKTEVSIKQVRQDAEELFRSGGFYCSEALVYAIRKNIDPDMPDALIRAASGFPVGIGKSKCVCGAVSGAILAIGYFFGRSEPTNPQDPTSVKCLELANEVQQRFRDARSRHVLCCKIHTHGMDMASGEHKTQCISFTGEMAAHTAEVIVRELGLTNLDN